MPDITNKYVWAYAIAFAALAMVSKYLIPWHVLFS